MNAPLTLDLSTAHLGDVLMAMPAMRHGDRVITPGQHRVPGLPVEWLDSGAGLVAMYGRGHQTDAWLTVSGREPKRWELLPERERTLTVIAPVAAGRGRQWRHWPALRAALPHAVVVGATPHRELWMELLARAHTVICPNNGTAHMADALGVPKVVGLYGSLFDRTAPYWNRAYCVARDDMTQISLKDVLEKVNA